MKIKYEWVVLAFFVILIGLAIASPFIPTFSLIYSKTPEVERGGTLSGYIEAWIYDQPYGTESVRSTDECHVYYYSSIDVSKAPIRVLLGSHTLDCTISKWSYAGGVIGWRATYSCNIPNDFPLGTYSLLAEIPCDNGKTILTEEYPTSIRVVAQDTCTAGYKCKDKYTKCYQKSDCSWVDCTTCIYGCSNGKCNAPPTTTTEEKPIVSIRKTIGDVLLSLFRSLFG
ncbi:MAG: hypothetical protein J7K62_03245 [Thermoplasmata archaeon]|nr:hypothetical protein [Thermoplasmata archaeon]